MKEEAKSKIDTAWDYFQKNELDKALKICKSIVNVKKHALNANYLMGHIFFVKNDFTNALGYFIKALELDVEKKGGGTINYWIGKTYESTESWLDHDDNPIYDKTKAKQAYLEAITYDNYPSDTIIKLATNDKRDFEKQQLYELGLQKFPKEVDFYIRLAKLFKKIGYPLKQLNTLQLGIEQGIKSSGLFFNLAKYYYEEKDYVNSLKYFLECKKENNKEQTVSIIYYCIANCFFNQNNFVEAITNYKKGFQLTDKNDSSIWYNAMGLISCYDKQKKIEDCIQVLTAIPNGRNIFEYLSFDYGVIVYFDGEIMEEVNFEDNVKKIIPIISKINKNSEETLKFKTSLLLAELYESDNNQWNKLNILRSCSPYPIGFDFLETKLVETYVNIISNSFSNSIGEIFIEDLKKDFLSNESEERIAEDLVRGLFKEKQYQKIVDICEELNDKQVENANLVFEYAYSLKTLDKWKESKLYYEKYLKVHPKSSAALNNLGVIYKEQQDFEKAIQLFKEAIKFDHEEEKLYHNNLKNTIDQLEKKRKEEKEKKIPANWSTSIKIITVQELDKLGYFDLIPKIEKINKKYKSLVERDFKELVFNYLVDNYKSTVVISGSLVEMVLTYYCEKKKITTLQFKDTKGNTRNIKLYDCVLNDLITYIGDKKLFGSDFHYLGNLARIYRNYIHPSLELKNKGDIRPKANLCFMSTLEILRKILN